MSTLFDYIDRSTFEAALQHLGTTPEQFAEMTWGEISELIRPYGERLDAHLTRQRARLDQLSAARSTMRVPEGMGHTPLFELARDGVIDMGNWMDSMQTLTRVQAEEDLDPYPGNDDVDALLVAVERLLQAGDAG
jgi:hypothetical protein